MDEDICDLTHLFETMDLEVFLLERDDERLPEQTTKVEFVESISNRGRYLGIPLLSTKLKQDCKFMVDRIMIKTKS